MASNVSDYEKKLIEMQYHMKENQFYMQDYFKELDSWSTEMKEKEKKILENPDIIKSSNKGLPPIRSLSTTKKKKKIKKTPQENGEKDSTKKAETKAKKLSTYDYRAWDKLDVDKLCQEVDERKTSSSEYTTDEEWEEEQRKKKANWEKERGNQFFKDNLLNEAINCYTRAIGLDPDNAVYPANRAMCLIKQEKYAAAEVDCTLSISLDPKYTKAYHRRATCRTHLKKYQDAKKDFETMLVLEPTSKLAQQEIQKIDELIEGRQLVFPIEKKEEEKSKKPLKRIEIQEINVESNERNEIEKNLEKVKQSNQLSAKEEKLFDLDSSKKTTSKESTSETKSKSVKIIELDETQTNGSQIEEKTEKLIEKSNLVEDKKASTQTQSQKVPSSTSTGKKIPDAPTNAYQFRKDWQFLSDNLESLATYFKKISPKDYEKLFLNGLESDNLSKILFIFKEYFTNDTEKDLFTHLKHLSKVKRFQTQLMLLSSADKKNIQDLMQHLKSSNTNQSADVDDLIKIFNDF